MDRNGKCDIKGYSDCLCGEHVFAEYYSINSHRIVFFYTQKHLWLRRIFWKKSRFRCHQSSMEIISAHLVFCWWVRLKHTCFYCITSVFVTVVTYKVLYVGLLFLPFLSFSSLCHTTYWSPWEFSGTNSSGLHFLDWGKMDCLPCSCRWVFCQNIIYTGIQDPFVDLQGMHMLLA